MNLYSFSNAGFSAIFLPNSQGLLGIGDDQAGLGHYGITVNAVAPGMIDTEPARKMINESLQSRESFQRRIEATPLRRIGTPDDIANAVVYLASSDASYITGEILHVTGGFY
jgi:3-oxoacyl-[acyl-carrier protein] reductase